MSLDEVIQLADLKPQNQNEFCESNPLSNFGLFFKYTPTP